MPRIASRLDAGSDSYRANRERMRELVAELNSQLERVRAGGGEAAVERHRARGKLPARERIERLLDPGAAFLELSPLAAHGLYDGEAPAAGIVTGIGPVAGRQCVIVANDATVKGGTYYPMTVKKHLRAQEIAAAEPPAVHLPRRLRRRVPAAAGRGLPRPRPLRPHLLQPGAHVGRRASRRSRVVMGSCTAGGAYVPAMCDEAVIVRGTGTIFLGGPPLVKAATGEEVTAEELGGADVHARICGVADHFARRRRARARDRARDRRRTWATRRRTPWERREPGRAGATTRPSSTASSRPTCASRSTCAR